MNTKQKNLLITAVVILAVIAIGSIAYGYYQKKVADMVMDTNTLDQVVSTSTDGTSNIQTRTRTNRGKDSTVVVSPQPIMRTYIYGKVSVPYPGTWSAKLQGSDLVLTPPNPASPTDFIVFTSVNPTCSNVSATNCTLITDPSKGVADVLKTTSINQTTLGVFSQLKAGIKILK